MKNPFKCLFTHRCNYLGSTYDIISYADARNNDIQYGSFYVKTFNHYKCSKCNTIQTKAGEEVIYDNNGQMLLSYPPKFVHKCTNCNKEYTLNEKYPMVTYKYL